MHPLLHEVVWLLAKKRKYLACHQKMVFLPRLNQQLETAKTASFPENWGKYGGWKDKKLDASGFFRTHNDGKRWWLVDPDGYVFVSGTIKPFDEVIEKIPSLHY